MQHNIVARGLRSVLILFQTSVHGKSSSALKFAMAWGIFNVIRAPGASNTKHH